MGRTLGVGAALGVGVRVGVGVGVAVGVDVGFDVTVAVAVSPAPSPRSAAKGVPLSSFESEVALGQVPVFVSNLFPPGVDCGCDYLRVSAFGGKLAAAIGIGKKDFA